MEKHYDLIRTRLSESNAVRAKTIDHSRDDIVKAADIIACALRAGNKLMLCGNGGSAADCQHLAAEFVCRLRKDFERRALPAMALTTDTSFLTAYANDFGYEGAFARQVEAFAQRGDVVLGISTSGSSPNVVRAINQARSSGCITIALTGEGGCLRELADITIAVPSTTTQYIQECHLSIEHVICELVEQMLFADKPREQAAQPEAPQEPEERPVLERLAWSIPSRET